MCVGSVRCGVRGIQYYNCIVIIFEVLIMHFADLVKRSVLALVSEIRLYGNELLLLVVN